MDITLTLLVIASIFAYRYYRRYKALERTHRPPSSARHQGTAQNASKPTFEVEDIDYEEVD